MIFQYGRKFQYALVDVGCNYLVLMGGVLSLPLCHL